jgi:hypothetical protein
MLPFLSALVLAQTSVPAIPAPTVSPIPAPTPSPAPPESKKEISLPQEVRPLLGQLDPVPTFNSNSPELLLSEGILLSTFPSPGKAQPSAHLDVPLQGRFDVFAHHVAKAPSPGDLRTLYLGVMMHNPGSKLVTVDILQAASFLSQPDAPFNELPAMVENSTGAVFAGPGSRATDVILRGQRQAGWPDRIEIASGQSAMLMNVPIPVKTLDPPLNGRSTLARLRSSGTVYAASLALFAPQNPDGSERPPTLEEWQTLLKTGKLATPRDRTPTPPDQTKGKVVYGRVAGVAQGSRWRSLLVDPGATYLTIPTPGAAISYGLSTLLNGRLGTGQVQSATMTARYPDTAYQAHGNYAIEYDMTFPLRNSTAQPQTVAISLQTPIKQDESQGSLRFFEVQQKQVFFRGTVRIRYTDEKGLPETRYYHLVQHRGQQGEPLATIMIPPNSNRLVQVNLLYPPDSTPPQILTIKTLAG